MDLRRGTASVISICLGVASLGVATGEAGARSPHHGKRHGTPPAFVPTFTEAACPEAPAPPAASAPGDEEAAPEVRCGFVTVPLEHRRPHEGTIDLFTAVVAASDPAQEGADPVLFLGGGPGQHTVEPFLPAATTPGAPLDVLHRDRDLVLLDQRGVGLSRPALECPQLDAAMEGVSTGDEIRERMVPAMRECAEVLRGEGNDLSAFHTANNVRDLDLVREALGYEQLHVFGTSYGARLAWQAARVFPERLASLVLSSPIPADQNYVVDSPRSLHRAIRVTADACAADAVCDETYPDLTATLDDVLAELRSDPGEITIVDPTTDEPVTLTVNHETAALGLLTLFYLPNGSAFAPFVITELAEGDLDVLGPLLSGSAVAGAISQGMRFSFLCAEEARNVSRLELGANLHRGGQVGRALWSASPVGAALEPICEAWDVDPAPREVFRPLVTKVPTFVATGQFDPITPPVYGRIVDRRSWRSQYVEVPATGHSPLLSVPCGAQLVTTFMADPTAPVDTSCLPSEPFFLPPDEAAAALGLEAGDAG